MKSSITRRRFLKTASRVAFGITVLSPLASLAATKKNSELARSRDAAYTMGTIMTIEVFGKEDRACRYAIDAAIKEVKEIDRLMSVFDERSQLSEVNRHAGECSVMVDRRLIEVLQASLLFYDTTNGAFDATIEPLMEIWGFRTQSRERKPTDRELYE
ncbi:MAG: FAD:protein FMN transferase, partial [Bacteroidota bacterium]